MLETIPLCIDVRCSHFFNGHYRKACEKEYYGVLSVKDFYLFYTTEGTGFLCTNLYYLINFWKYKDSIYIHNISKIGGIG